MFHPCSCDNGIIHGEVKQVLASKFNIKDLAYYMSVISRSTQLISICMNSTTSLHMSRNSLQNASQSEHQEDLERHHNKPLKMDKP